MSHPKHDHFSHVPKEIKIGLVIVSTSRFDEQLKGLTSTDRSIPIFREKLSCYQSEVVKVDFIIAYERIIPDEKNHIENALNDLKITH